MTESEVEGFRPLRPVFADVILQMVVANVHGGRWRRPIGRSECRTGRQQRGHGQVVGFHGREELASFRNPRTYRPAACGILQSTEAGAAKSSSLFDTVLEGAGENRLADALAVMGMSAAAELGMKELDRLSLAKTQMEMRIRDRRSNSNLPGLIDLVLSRPIVSGPLIARHLGITPRGALNLVRELGVREMTGRGRYRGWGVL